VLVSLIAAVAANRVIGRDGAMPWRLPADMAYFKRLTMGHPVIMGRKTFMTLKKALTGRLNIVLSRDPAFTAAGAIAARSVDEALDAAARALQPDNPEAFVIGGAQIYALFLPRADRLYITHVDQDMVGTELFPELDLSEWKIVHSEAGAADGANPLPHRFVVYERKKS
jgi:dihydrofolate reductase